MFLNHLQAHFSLYVVRTNTMSQWLKNKIRLKPNEDKSIKVSVRKINQDATLSCYFGETNKSQFNLFYIVESRFSVV